MISSLALTTEPEDLMFLNTMPSKLECAGEGYPIPKIRWLNEKGSIVQPKSQLQSINNGELIFHAFLPNQYDEAVHNAKYRCEVSNEVGRVVSNLVHVKAGK